MEEEKKQSTCPKCDNLITDDCKKCPNCGYRLNKGSKLLSILIIFVLILLAISIYLIYLKGQNKEDTSYGKKYDGKDIQIDNNTSDTKYVLKEYVDYDFDLGENSKIYGNREYLMLKAFSTGYYYYLKNHSSYDIGLIISDNWGCVSSNNNLYNCKAIENSEREGYFTKFLNKGFPMGRFYDIVIFSDEYFASRKDSKHGKYGLLNKDGSIILDYEYDDIFFESVNIDVVNPKYFFIEKDDRVGIASKNGKIIVEPLYQQLNYRDYNYSIIIDSKGNYYFILSKDDNYYTFNEEGKKIFEFQENNIIKYNYILNKFERINVVDNKIDNIEFYDTDGNFIKKLDLTEYNISEEMLTNHETRFLEKYKYYEEFSYNTLNIIPMSKKEALIIDSDLNTRIVDNVYFRGNIYYITDKFYITYSDKKYNVYTIDGELIIDNINRLISLDTTDYILCKDYDSKCALFSSEGNLLTDFTYEYMLEKVYGVEDSVILKDNNNHILYLLPDNGNGEFKKLTCKNEISGFLDKYSSKNFIIKNDDGSFSIYDYDCNKIVQKKYDNIEITDSGIIVAKLSEDASDYSNFRSYDIIVDNKIIEYKNLNSVSLDNFIGEANNMLFFRYGKRLYYIDLDPKPSEWK